MYNNMISVIDNIITTGAAVVKKYVTHVVDLVDGSVAGGGVT